MAFRPDSRPTTTPSPNAAAPSFISQQVTDARRFYLATQRPPADGLSVVCGGWEDCASQYVIDRATFPYFAVEFIAAGEGTVWLADRRHALRAGTVFSYGPGISQKMQTSPDRPMRKYFVAFAGRRARALLARCRLSPGTVLPIGNSPEVQIALDTLIRIGTWRHADVPRMAALQLELVLLVIRHGTAPSTPDARRAFATFERCRQIIDTYFLELRSVREAAQRCHVTGSHLSRLFHLFYGVGPLRYIHQRQMECAAQRLHSSSALVREVADELGLDPFHFSRLFKRIHGLAPSAFVSSRRQP
jgi:AraC-like DNA-binding protein